MQVVLVTVLVATVAFLAGRFLMESSLADILIGTIGGLIIAACVIGLIVMTMSNRRRHQFSIGRADRWENAHRDRRQAAQLQAFWRSPTGQGIQKNPVLVDDSVRIEPIDSRKAPDAHLGLLTVLISKTHVAYVQVAVPRRRKHWLMDRVTWLANHRALPAWAWRWMGNRLGYIDPPPPFDRARWIAEHLPDAKETPQEESKGKEK